MELSSEKVTRTSMKFKRNIPNENQVSQFLTTRSHYNKQHYQ